LPAHSTASTLIPEAKSSLAAIIIPALSKQLGEVNNDDRPKGGEAL
jgi:hypothetical protein